eukprot:CAMPEP_0178751226 /NCGR_PEP_ID=MMETSP0744-20121128/10419_1 /TAXON_ID=913974 /ORGANISM="Nitzschia punctata, Strain CCMP561" /LENGTH=361 /DNA_ID=CAMNT_0020404869 /DNA_START=211 /DNA_END=1296 /DNA_ORIENTATION=+
MPAALDRVCVNNTAVVPRYSIGKVGLHREQSMSPQPLPKAENTIPRKMEFEIPTVSESSAMPTSFIINKATNGTTIEELRKDQKLPSSKLPFLWKLHLLLDDVEATGNEHIVSWLEHGRSFKVYRPKTFIASIAPFYFKQSKYKSFQRQLHLYEFTRTPYGPEAGSYSHPLFVRGQPDACLSLSPIKIKGKAGRQANLQKAKAAAAAAAAAVTAGSPSPGKLIPSQMQMATSPGKMAKSSVATAVLSKKEQTEWVAKIKGMLVKGSTLAAQIKGGDETKYDEVEMEESHFPSRIASGDASGDASGYDYPCPAAVSSGCDVFGGCSFHAIPRHNHDVNTCDCCQSDHEDEDDLEYLSFMSWD